MSLQSFRPGVDWLECYKRHGNHYVCVWRVSPRVTFYPSIKAPPPSTTTLIKGRDLHYTEPNTNHARSFQWNDEQWTRAGLPGLLLQDGPSTCSLFSSISSRSRLSPLPRDFEWWEPEGPQIVLGNTSTMEFRTWLAHAMETRQEDLDDTLEQPPVEHDHDTFHSTAPGSDRIRHMALHNERRARRRIRHSLRRRLCRGHPPYTTLSSPSSYHAGCNLEKITYLCTIGIFFTIVGDLLPIPLVSHIFHGQFFCSS